MAKAQHNFNVSVTVNNQTGNVIAVYLRIRDGKQAETKEMCNGSAFADYDSRGRLLGVEMIAPCEVEALDRLSKEPKVRKFIRSSAPQHMVLC